MREKVFKFLNMLYGATLAISFFAGLLPIIPFVIAIIIGDSTGEAIAVFLYKQYYPWVIIAASVSVLIGWVAMYVRKKAAKSPKTDSKDAEDNTEKDT